MKIHTPLKRRKPPNTHSLKKIAELTAEAPIRRALAIRAHGEIREYFLVVKRNDVIYRIPRVVCVNGICECGCGQRGNLEPHENPRRSQGNKVSMKSIMVRRDCHNRLDGRNVRLRWIN